MDNRLQGAFGSVAVHAEAVWQSVVAVVPVIHRLVWCGACPLN
jgi:hypothetical protein